MLAVEFFRGEQKVGTLTIGRTVKATGEGVGFTTYAYAYGGGTTPDGTQFDNATPSENVWKENRQRVDDDLKIYGLTMHELRRTHKSNVTIPDRETFLRGCIEFEKNEKRDAMYKVATFLVDHFWGKPSDMADGLGVLLLTWNQAFYRYGSLDHQKLDECITRNLHKLEGFRSRDILSLSTSDEDDIRNLFNEFLEALQIASGKAQGRKSPVAVAKALHLLAPKFFPPWDTEIELAYHCYYNKNPAERYVLFCRIMKAIADEVKNYVARSDKTLVKLIDEYNYSRYTQGWI